MQPNSKGAMLMGVQTAPPTRHMNIIYKHSYRIIYIMYVYHLATVGIVTVVNELHFEKVYFSMLVTDDGMSARVNALQP